MIRRRVAALGCLVLVVAAAAVAVAASGGGSTSLTVMPSLLRPETRNLPAAIPPAFPILINEMCVAWK